MVLKKLDTCKKKNLDTDITLFIKLNSKWIINLNVKRKTVKVLEDNTGENQGDLRFNDEFLDATSKEQSTKEKNDKLDH